MSTTKKSVGIKGLKDGASAVINSVIRHGRPVTVTKNNKEVARIVPIEEDIHTRLSDRGLVASWPKLPWKSLRLEGIRRNSSPAIRGIRADRDET